MATRMQQRRGTAAQWVSTNSGNGPVLEAGEIGFESDTGKFKIGDGTNHWANLEYFLDESQITNITDDYVLSSTLGQVNGVATLDGSGKLTSSQIPTIDELSQDAVNSALIAGIGLDKTYNDGANTITIDIDSTVTTNDGAQTLTNKTLTSPVINGATIGGSLIPSVNATYDLGSSTNKFKDLYLSGSTLYLDAATIALHSGNVQLAHSGNTTTIPIGGGAHTVATESYVNTAVSNLVDTAPSTLNTLNELAAAINDDASFASTITTALGNKLDSSTASSTYAPIASPTFTGTVSGITATMVGLGNVDNTSDANKPVSTATQTALDLKAPLASPTFTGIVTLPNGTVTSSNITWTYYSTEMDLPAAASNHGMFAHVHSTGAAYYAHAGAWYKLAKQTDLDLKAPLESPTFTGTVTLPAGTSGANLVNIPNSALTNSSITINGSAVSLGGSATIQTGYVPIPTTSVSSNISLSSNNRYFVDTSAARTLTLPASPTAGDEIQIFDTTGSAATNNIVIDSNSNKINGTVQNLEVDINYDIVVLVYTGSGYGWVVV